MFKARCLMSIIPKYTMPSGIITRPGIVWNETYVEYANSTAIENFCGKDSTDSCRHVNLSPYLRLDLRNYVRK